MIHMKKITAPFFLICFFAVLSEIFAGQLFRQGKLHNLSFGEEKTADFRSMELGEEAVAAMLELEKSGYTKGTMTAVLLPWYDYRTPPEVSWDRESFEEAYGAFQTFRKEEFRPLLLAAQAVWDDLEVFPVPSAVTFENSWMSERNYGGPRGHEGCDLMPKENRRDFYPVRSMTDGVVEKIGWLPKGGYRIGIRSEHGGYFYYAHFSSYAKTFKQGEAIQAGEVLGYMGDSGYGEEGTVGKFDVHLHLGIYVTGEDGEEISINPYWILYGMQKESSDREG